MQLYEQAENTVNALMTRQQVAEYLGLCLSIVDRLDIPRIKISERRRAYLKSDVDSWIESHKEERETKHLEENQK